MNTIRCPKCGEVKPATEFHNNAGRPNGKAGYCRKCMCGIVTSWKKRNPEMMREQRRRAKQRAAERSREDERTG